MMPMFRPPFATMRRALALLLSTLGMASAHATALAADLDTTFGNGGVALLESGDDSYVGYGPVQWQGDRHAVACTRGVSIDGLRYTDFLVRLDANGSRDGSFGVGGLVDLDSTLPTPDCTGLVAQANGGIVVAQRAWTDAVPHSDAETVLRRFDADGHLDMGFGSGTGAVHLNFSPGAIDGIAQITSRSDGSLVVASAEQPAVLVTAVFLDDGTPDESFGSHGISRVHLPEADTIGGVGAVFVDGLDRVILAGAIGGPSTRFAAVRLRQNGDPDDAFGQHGLAMVALEGNAQPAVAVPLMDGRILLAGSVCQSPTPTNAGGCQVALVRLQDDGTIDDTFAEHGKLMIAIDHVAANAAYIMSGARRPQDGKIVLVGNSGEGSQRNGLILQLDADGTPDEAFAAQGAWVIDIPMSEDRSAYLRGVSTTVDRTIVFGTSFGSGTMATSRDFVIALERDAPTQGHSRHERVGFPPVRSQTPIDPPR